jgi:hypothetical protein
MRQGSVNKARQMGRTVVYGRLNVVKDRKRTSQIVGFGRGRQWISLQTILVRIYLARDHRILLAKAKGEDLRLSR